jgi:hypothetical protein
MIFFNELSLLEILVATSLLFQIGTIIFTLYLLRFSGLPRSDKRPWVWFIISLGVTLFRRLMAVCRYSFDCGSVELEYVVTILISICWIMVVYTFLERAHINGTKNERTPRRPNK